MRTAGLLLRLSQVGLACLLCGSPPWTTRARAADPQPYTVTIKPTGDSGLDQALHASATLISLEKTAPVGPFALVARARRDAGRLTTALDSYGYYLGTVTITVDGLRIDDPALPARLDGVPAGKAVAVVVTPTTGPLFHIGHVSLHGDVPPGTDSHLTIKSGDPARAAPVLAAGQALQRTLRDEGRPLATVAAPVATLDIGTKTLDVSYPVKAGPVADIGPITISGEKRLNTSYIRRRLMLHEGERYDPRKIEKAREDLAAVPAVASVRITQPDALDTLGQMPLFVQLAERPLHAVSFGAAWSTDQGGSVSASWMHRNLFGNAETLVLSAAATQLGGTATTRPGYNFGALLTLPDLYARGQNLAFNAQALKESLQAYDRTAEIGSVILTRKLGPEWSVSGGISFEQARITQEGVTRDYNLPQLPLSVTYDSTHSLFDPAQGIKATLSLIPTYSLAGGDGSIGHDTGFVIAQLSGSTYFDFGRHLLGEAPGRSILAVRGLVGTISGAGTFDIPPDQRFYAGGGGTIRGWRYQSVGPTFPDGTPAGGTSIEVGSIEYRQRVLNHYGFVLFADTGQVGGRGTSLPGGNTVRVGVGAGLRYFTSIGPIRLDVGVPVNRSSNIKTDAAEVYIGIGQAF